MSKAKYNYNGHLSLGGQIALLIIFCIVLILAFLSWKPTEIQQQITLLLAILSFISIIYWIANNLINNLKKLEINDGELILTNLLSKKVQKIELKKLAGFKYNGLTQKTELVDLHGEIIAKIYNPFYKDLNEFFLEKNVNQIGVDERYLRGLTI